MHSTTTIIFKRIICLCKSDNNFTDLLLLYISQRKAWGSRRKLGFHAPFDDFDGFVLPFPGQGVEGGMEGTDENLNDAERLQVLEDFIFALAL